MRRDRENSDRLPARAAGFVCAGGVSRGDNAGAGLLTAAGRGASRLRVLVVDEQPEIRLALRTLVETLGAELREAGSGEHALEVLAQWVPHVLIADDETGAVSGLDLLVRVRERYPQVRVLMVAGGSAFPTATISEA